MSGSSCSNDLESSYICHCVEGFVGRDCSVNIDECAGQPCQNGATCVDLVRSCDHNDNASV